jgi:hypothetical protein
MLPTPVHSHAGARGPRRKSALSSASAGVQAMQLWNTGRGVYRRPRAINAALPQGYASIVPATAGTAPERSSRSRSAAARRAERPCSHRHCARTWSASGGSVAVTSTAAIAIAETTTARRARGIASRRSSR